MKVPLRWLAEFIDLPTEDPAELKAVLEMLGHEVEGYQLLTADWSDVVVGRVEEITAHPDADKIRVCQVDSGGGVEQIICGAWNFSEGAHVAVAKPGAVLPGDFEIGRREIRGVTSNGMICSEKELGLGEDHTGILVLEGEPELGREFAELVELPDVVFDLSITPNRPDAMSLLGIARDLAASYQIDYRIPELPLTPVPGSTDVDVVVEDPDGCPRFTAREIRGVSMGPSPLRVRHRLNKVGVRSISNVVDVTNYVMLELGHPLHAFDADSIVGRKLRVRRASDGESLVTLDGFTRNLTSADLIIYDEEGPTSMSGTMGGERSEVSGATVNVLMEAASWHPPTIMYMSRRHGLISEASTRFERGVDPNLAELANQRASAMVTDVAGGEVLEGSIDVYETIDPVTLELRLWNVERLLGDGFDRDLVGGILERLGMDVSGDDPMTVMVPTYRPDITRPVDLVEEVARIHGYDKFGATVPTGPAGFLTAEQTRLRKLRSTLSGIGLSQTVTLPFISEDDLERLDRTVASEKILTVKNPLREEEGRLRPAMLPGLLKAARRNFSYGARSVAIFETGLVFTTDPYDVDPRLPAQIDRLAWLVAGPVGVATMGREESEPDAAYSLGVLRHLLESLGIKNAEIRPGSAPGYHPGRTATVSLQGSAIGVVGELSPAAARAFEIPGRVAVAELDLQPILQPVELTEAVMPSVYPHVDFDLSFEVNTESALGDLIAATSEAAAPLVESAVVFDEFRDENLGADRRAVAIRYRLRAPDRTLSNEELAPLRDAMIEAAGQFGARLRGT